jgi:long-chain acyl-CoA synthetase
VNECLLHEKLSAAIDAAFEAVDPQKHLLVGPVSLTYGTLKDRMGRLQTLFNHYGLVTGDRVVVISGQDSCVISLYFASVRAGLVAVIGNREATADEVARLIAAADPRMVFIDRAIMPIEAVVALVPENCHAISIDDTGSRRLVSKLLRENRVDDQLIVDREAFPALLDKFKPASFAAAPPGAAVAHMLFTSGTTSRPKGVEITHGNIRAQLSTFLSVYGYDANSRILNILPLHHTDGLMQGPMVAFIAGATVYRPRQFSVAALPELMATVRGERITHFIVVPTMLALMMRLDEEYNDSFRDSDLRVLRSSADLLDPTLWRLFEKRFGVEVTNSYGLTETVCEAIYCGPAPVNKRIGTIGKPIDCKARIVDNSGNAVSAGTVGELWISGTNIMKGYFRQPEETAAVLIDGWYRTGDLARMDADGFFAIAGRKKTVIITGGTNVHPENITTTIRDLNGVIDAVTFGLKDEVFGEIVVSCVVVAPDSGLDVDAILAHCRAYLSAEKVPAAVYLLDELPRGPAGKVLLDDVKALATKRANEKIKSTGDIREQVLEIAAQTFKVPISTLTPGSTPDNTNGWDSLAHTSLIAALERQFSIGITAPEIVNLRSLADAERIVRRKHAPFTAPTIGRLSEDVETATDLTESQSLVPLRVSKAGLPLFLVSGRAWLAMYYRHLLQDLKSDCPIYGLQPPPLDGKHRIPRTVESIASAYVSEIRRVQSHGPYYIAGHSFGGMVSFEMAQQLVREGERVNFLGLIDTFFHEPPVNGRPLMSEAVHLSRRVRHVDSFRDLIFHGLRFIRNAVLDQWVRQGLSIPYEYRSAYYEWLCTRAVLNYAPRPYPGRIAMFSSAGNSALRRAHWTPLARDGLTILEVPAGHVDMVLPPNSKILAKHFDECLNVGPVRSTNAFGLTVPPAPISAPVT